MNRIVISGASGFLGTNIIKKAQELDIEVLAIAFPGELKGIVPTVSIYEFLQGQVRFERDDVFINCLFPTNADGKQMAAGLKTLYGTIEMAYRSDIYSFINISSQSVYSPNRKVPAKEEDLLCLETPYAVGKFSSEAYTNYVFSKRYHTNIRLASLLGIGYDLRIVNRMIMQAIAGKELTVVGGMQRYGFLDVRDAADGLVRIATSKQANWKDVYNLGRVESYTLLEVVGIICKELKDKYGIDTKSSVTDGIDERNSSIDPTRFIEEFKWVPQISLAKTIEDIIDSKIKAGV